MSLSVALPFVSLVLLAVNLERRSGDWRAAALEAAVAWGVFLTLVTEGLSLLGLLTVGWLAASWAAGTVAFAAWFGSIRRAGATGEGPQPPPAERLSTGPRILLGAVAVLLALVGLTALVAPPNTWDSLAYHMPRVAEWIQGRSVSHFPTPYLPQLEHPPFAEFAILHLQVLYGGDRFANVVQWLALAGSLIGVSLVAGQFGAKLRAQVFAAVVAATLPMGILQGSSTQNDLVVSFWVVAFAFFVLRTIAAEKLRSGDAFWLGASLGLALLTKGTAYFYAAPFCIWLAAVLIRRLRWRVWQPGLVIVGSVLLLNVGHFGRNAALFGRPLSDGGAAANQIRTPAAIASIAIKNLSLHVGTPFGAVNRRIDGVIRALHRPLGLDVNDPRTTCWGEFHIPNVTFTHEDSAGNPLHFLLAFAGVAALAWRRRLRGHLAGYALAIGAAFFLFCLMLKYQPWHSRLHTPFFLLLAPVIGLALQELRRAGVAYAVAAALLLSSIPFAVLNRQRPILPMTTATSGYRHAGQDRHAGLPSILAADRVDQYFASPFARHLREPYLKAAEVLRGQRGDVGLLLPENAFEYPLWVLLKSDGGVGRLANVGVRNVSAAAGRTGVPFTPSALLRVTEAYVKEAGVDPPPGDRDARLDTLVVAGSTYVRRWVFGPVDVFLRETAASAR